MCYRADPGNAFLIYRPTDDSGEELIAPGEEMDFLQGRSGDHLFCPFECDFCAFHRMRGHSPVKGDKTDDSLMNYIRRANLDAFWSRRPGTINGLNTLMVEQIEAGERFGFDMFPPPGPMPTTYESGMKAAVGILYRSTKPGRHEKTLKYSSVRKARSLHTDVYNASARATEGAMVWRSDRARFIATRAPTESAWFERFMIGFRARIGERRKQDAAISIEIMKSMQETLQEEWDEAVMSSDIEEQRDIAEHAAFYLLLYCGSLRGFEGPKATLHDLRRQIVPPGSELAGRSGAHLGLSLTGRFKARSQYTDTILIHIAYETASGLQPGMWVERLVSVLERLGITNGWVFQERDGEQRKMAHFETDFYDRLYKIQSTQPDLFAEGLNITEDFHLARSFRRGATTRATAAGVSAEDIEYINRWNIRSESGGSVPMRVLYSDRTQLIDAYLRFSLAL